MKEAYKRVLTDFKIQFVDNPKNRWLYGQWGYLYQYRKDKATDIVGLYLGTMFDTELESIKHQPVPEIYEQIKRHLPVDNMSFWWHMQILHDDVHTNFTYFYQFATQYDLRDKLFDGKYNELGYTYNWQGTAESLGLPLFTEDGKRRFNWVIDKFCPELQELKFDVKPMNDWGGRWYIMIGYRNGIPTGVS